MDQKKKRVMKFVNVSDAILEKEKPIVQPPEIVETSRYTTTVGSQQYMWTSQVICIGKLDIFLTFIDKYSRMYFVNFLKANYEVCSPVRYFVELVEPQLMKRWTISVPTLGVSISRSW